MSSAFRNSWQLTPDEQITINSYILIKVSLSGVDYHLLHFRPIWGYVLVAESKSVAGWRDELNQLCGIALDEHTDTAELIFFHGLLPLGDGKTITLEEIMDTFSNICIRHFSSISIEMPDAVMLVQMDLPGMDVSSEVHKQFVDVLCRSMNIENILEGYLRHFPTAHEIRAYIDHQTSRCPWHVQLNIAHLRSANLESIQLDLLTEQQPLQSSSTGESMFSGISGDLFLAPGESHTSILVKGTNSQTHELFKYFCEIAILAQPFRVGCLLHYPDIVPVVTLENAVERSLLDTEATHTATQMPKLVEHHSPIEVLLIIDGTINPFERLRAFITRLFRTISGASMNFRAGYVVYGQYFSQGSAFEVQTLQLGSVRDAHVFAESIRPLQMEQRKLSIAMELGLRTMNDMVDWQTKTRHVVLIGSSPPHPTIWEVQQYGLFETTTESFQGIVWSDELARLKAKARQDQATLMFTSVWLKPPFVVDSNQASFAEHVWRAFGEDGGVFSDLDEANAQQIAHFIQSQSRAEPVFQLEKRLALPVNAPLENILPLQH